MALISVVEVEVQPRKRYCTYCYGDRQCFPEGHREPGIQKEVRNPEDAQANWFIDGACFTRRLRLSSTAPSELYGRPGYWRPWKLQVRMP